jgi:hypothetical protein
VKYFKGTVEHYTVRCNVNFKKNKEKFSSCIRKGIRCTEHPMWGKVSSYTSDRLWSWKLFWKPARNVQQRKSTSERRWKPEQKFIAAFGTIFRLRSVFREASGNVVFIYFFNKAGKNLKTICG